MLHQEINLYRAFESHRPAAQFLSWKRLLYSQLLFLILLCLCCMYSFSHLYYLKSHQAALIQEASRLEHQFFELKKQFPQLFFSQDVSQTLKKLQVDLDAEKKILHSLETPIPFSKNLIELSKNIVPNVWLTNILFSKSGNNIHLEGLSTNVDSLQKFIANIEGDKLYQAFIVTVDNITQPDHKNTKDNITFKLNLVRESS